MADNRYLTYRGQIRAVMGNESTLTFVTVHPEGQPTALYRINTDDDTLTEIALPCGGVALTSDGSNTYVAGTDRRLYSIAKKAAQPLGDALPHMIVAIAAVAGDRLAVAGDTTLSIVSRADGKVLQSFVLPESAQCLATDKTGQWLAVGTEGGTIAVFDGQDKPEFEPAESGKLHDGAVTAIAFEPEELRFFSTGADRKLLSTHARGKLEPEDKGRGNTHEDLPTTLLYLPQGDRLLSGGRDAALKSWPRSGAIKPVTVKDGIGRAVAMTLLTSYGESVLAVVSDDDAIRIHPLTEDGRLDREEGDFEEEYDETLCYRGAMDWAREELAQTYDSKQRAKTLKTLASWNDAASLELIAKTITADPDPSVRAYAAKTLGHVQNPRVVTLLEPHMGHKDEKVRVAVFAALQQQLVVPDLRPIDAALNAKFADVGVLAVNALEPLARTDDQALARLVAALDALTWDVRKAALSSLEAVFPTDSPQSSLTALNSTHGDLRALALIRLLNRNLLGNGQVQSAVRRRLEDSDATVRKVAFELSLLMRPTLAEALSFRDPELLRQLNELQKLETTPSAGAEKKLAQRDLDTLLQATASRALDTCLRGARGLALLGDPRAFGLLLQLSREDDPPTRTEVCRALAALGDARAVNRLRSLLFDSVPSVRDAAYSSLVKLEAEMPLRAAESGLAAPAEDVRRRALQTLAEVVKKQPPQSSQEPGWSLLVQALNDGNPGVRGEAFKIVVNQKIGGGGEGSLRFARQSSHASVRREVLMEIAAQIAEAWATALLYEFFDDADAGLRSEAYAIAIKKNKELPPLEAALASRYPDTRLLAIEALAKKHSPAAQAILLKSVADPIIEVRQKAIESLIEDDAREALLQALKAAHLDIRARAALALAQVGDSASLLPLRELAFAPEPLEAEKIPAWRSAAEVALNGLQALGEPAVLPQLVQLLDSPHSSLRAAAANAIGTAVRAETLDAIRTGLAHSDPAVRFPVALALAYYGDGTVGPLVQSEEARQILGSAGPFLAAVAGGPSTATALAVFLDHSEESLRRRALFVHMLIELANADGVPDLCLQVLSAKPARLRLAAAQGLEAFENPDTFRKFVVDLLNDRGEETPWKIPPEVVDSLSAIFAFGDPLLRVRTAQALVCFDQKDQAGWNQTWAILTKRFAPQIAEAKSQAMLPTGKLSVEELRELAFGAYVGLIREQGGSAATPAVLRVRQTAMARLFALASGSPAPKSGGFFARLFSSGSQPIDFRTAAQPVLIQALSDPNQAVRLQAFEHLQALNVAKTTLGAESLEAGFTDLGVKGLELLTDGTSSEEGEAVLERVLLTRTDHLTVEAAKLLIKVRGVGPVAALALDAVHEPLRLEAVRWLSSEYASSGEAQKALRLAVTSRYRKVREAAAYELAAKKDPTALEVLIQLLKDATEAQRQREVIAALQNLGDVRAVPAFFTRIEQDPTGTADAEALLEAIGQFRDPTSVDRLLKLADKADWRDSAFNALECVSGYDQQLPDPDEESAYAAAEKKGHPLRPEILSRIIEKGHALGTGVDLPRLISLAKGSRGQAVDAAISLLSAHPEEDIRHAALECLGWRAAHRSSSPEPLLKALKHKNPITQFYAAEGLAKAHRGEGLTILLSAVEYLDDHALRCRAVLALGELADSRSVDLLLRLANENGHALQEPAAVAIGHLGQTKHSDAIFRILERLSKSGSFGVGTQALVGLRWLNTAPAWAILRKKISDPNWHVSQTAAEQLRYNSDPATIDLLGKVLQTDTRSSVLDSAFDSLQVLLGSNSLEPHYALLVNPAVGADDGIGEAEIDVLREVCERGDALRIMAIFPKCERDKQDRLETALMTRPQLPVQEALAALSQEDEGTVRLAARLVGQAKPQTNQARSSVETALNKWWQIWETRRTQLDRGIGQLSHIHAAGAVLQNLFWTATQTGSPAAMLNDIALSRRDDPLARSLRLDAVRALATRPITAASVSTFAQLALGADAEVRTFSASILAHGDAPKAATLAKEFLLDAPSFSRVTAAGVEVLAVAQQAIRQSHSQPVALPTLLAAKDVNALSVVARDRNAAESVRLGAVEGLGFLGLETAEAALLELGRTQNDDEDIRKAAWKALQRSRRKRKKRVRSA